MRGLLLAVTVAVLLASCAAVPPAGSPSTPPVERSLDVTDPTDIRWDGDGEVLVSTLRRGLARISVDKVEAPQWLAEWPPGEAPGHRYAYIGVSDDFIAAADLPFQIRWRGRAPNDEIVNQPFEYVADIDVHDRRILIAGLRRDDTGQFAADGAFAWIGTLPSGALRPVLPFSDQHVVQNCAGFHVTAARFLSDGSFLIVPGAEPGIFLYNPQGRLQRNFASDGIDILSDCTMTREEESLLPSDPAARQRWINRRRVVDEIVELPSGPALIVRSRNETTTRWDLISLTNGTVRPLPFTSSSPWAHVAADSRNGRIAVLIADRTTQREGGAAPRLILWRP